MATSGYEGVKRNEEKGGKEIRGGIERGREKIKVKRGENEGIRKQKEKFIE